MSHGVLLNLYSWNCFRKSDGEWEVNSAIAEVKSAKIEQSTGNQVRILEIVRSIGRGLGFLNKSQEISSD
ncbi:hypothetical protein LEP1GSC196_2538 [Leptospira meyeri serovar Semaranga str. Veldrot Semarang 173]|nr:hypothetical protein LEP1GSC196_2538 [Leptospira meyeri serovar Semaranga str. Veldrot Semarang 173]